MQFKSITAIAVLSLVVASLLVAGCTTSTTSNTNQTSRATPSTAIHNATLEKYFAALKNVTNADKSKSVTAWEVTWINSTTARLEYAWHTNSNYTSYSANQTYIVFPTTQAATNYLNAMNKTVYNLTSTQYSSKGVYQNATGRAPATYKDYTWNEGNPSNLSEYSRHEIAQLDNIIVISTVY